MPLNVFTYASLCFGKFLVLQSYLPYAKMTTWVVLYNRLDWCVLTLTLFLYYI